MILVAFWTLVSQDFLFTDATLNFNIEGLVEAWVTQAATVHASERTSSLQSILRFFNTYVFSIVRKYISAAFYRVTITKKIYLESSRLRSAFLKFA